MRGVAKDLCWMDEEAKGKALVSVEEIIYSHAVGIDSEPYVSNAVFKNAGSALQISGIIETRGCT